MMPVWLIVPVKPFAEGKSRLTSTLSTGERAQLSRTLLTHVLQTTAASGLFVHTLVVSRDPAVAEVTDHFGVELLGEQGYDLNQALTQARSRVMDDDAETIVVLPSDLPRLTVTDLQRLVAAAGDRPTVALAPSRDGGTNALLLRPPDLFEFAFGPQSLSRHVARARKMGVEPSLIASPTLAFDLDNPTDLAEFVGERVSG